MKNLKRLLFVSIFSMAIMLGLSAQNAPKLGHINTSELIAAMPDSDSAQVKLQKGVKQLESQLEKMQVEFNNKYEDYINHMNEYSDLIRQTKEAELQEMNERIQAFKTNADQDMQKQRQKLFKPVLDKANAAIADVAKSNNFTYIFDTSSGVLIYTAENSQDILALVKTKLGLK